MTLIVRWSKMYTHINIVYHTLETILQIMESFISNNQKMNDCILYYKHTFYKHFCTSNNCYFKLIFMLSLCTSYLCIRDARLGYIFTATICDTGVECMILPTGLGLDKLFITGILNPMGFSLFR